MERRKPFPKPLPRIKQPPNRPPADSFGTAPQIPIFDSPNYDLMMARQVYNNLLAQSVESADLFRKSLSMGSSIDTALTAATSGSIPQRATASVSQPPASSPQIGIPKNFNQAVGQIPKFTMGSANPSAFQNFQNLVQNGVAQGNLRNMYEALKPPVATVGTVMPTNPNPPTSQFGSGLGGAKKFF